MSLDITHGVKSITEMIAEPTFVKNVEIKQNWKTTLNTVGNPMYMRISVGGGEAAHEQVYAVIGDKADYIHMIEQDNGTFIYAVVSGDENNISKFRVGKLSKVLAAMNMSQANIKKVMTAKKSGVKKYSLWLSNDFYHNYNMMEDLGYCTSCMSHGVRSYDVTVDGKEYSPLLGYEVSDNYSLALLRDEDKFESGFYPFVGRAVIHHSEIYDENQFYTTYGNEKINQALEGYAVTALGFEQMVAIQADDQGYVLPYLDNLEDLLTIKDIDGVPHFVNSEPGLDSLEANHSTGIATPAYDDEGYIYQLDGDWYSESDVGEFIRILENDDVVGVDDAVLTESTEEWHHIDDCELCEDTQGWELRSEAIHVEYKGTIYYFAEDDLMLDYDDDLNLVVSQEFKDNLAGRLLY